MNRKALRLCLFMLGAALAAPTQARTIEVTIARMVFSPADIEANVGDTIEWVNDDVLVHTATAKGAWEVLVAAGKSGRLLLKTPGNVDYFCRFHPNMKGRITVRP